MQRPQARNTFLAGLLLVAAALPVRAASIDLHLALSFDASAPDHTRVTGLIQNTGQVAALDVYAELWPDGARERLGAIQPGEQREVTWSIPSQRWVEQLRQVAAMRVRYRDALERWADAVVAAGQTSEASVTPPVWSEAAAFSLEWQEAPAPSGRIVWWRSFALGVLAADSWNDANGVLRINGHVSRSSAITGWKSSVYGLVLPDSPPGILLPGSIVRIEIDARERGPLWDFEWRWIAAWLAVCVLAWGAFSRRTAALPALTTVASLGAVALALIPPRLIALDTTPGGGDYASHIVALGYLRDVLLPSGRAFGWFPGQFAGFPLFLFYFPLPFLAAAALSLVLPLTVAFKTASLMGTLMLPVAWWLALSWLGAPRTARWIAAAGSAWLLLSEWQMVWGANLPSTLAGEFAYSLGFALSWMTMALAWKTRDERGTWRLLAVLFALTAMAHAYALLSAACGVLLMVIHPRRGPARGWRFAWLAAISFSLAAWWLVPFLWTAPWTFGVRGQWPVAVRDLLPVPLRFALAVALIGLVRRAGWSSPDERAGFIWLSTFSAALFGMYAAGFSFGVVDIRFLPFVQGALLLLACWEVGAWLEFVPPALAPAAASLVILATVGSAVRQVTYLPDWVRWNFSGMERTGPWPFYADVMRKLSGDLSDPRIAVENHPDHGDVGTPRAFELTPWFAGRSTLEGLYRENALLAVPVYYIQSELTQTPSCPIEGLECGRFDPARALPHLGLFAVDTIVTYGDTVARALEKQEGVTLRDRSGPYEVFSIDEPRPLVEPVRFKAVVDESAEWRAESLNWFRAGTDLDVPLILRRTARAGEPRVARYAPRSLPREPLAPAPDVVASMRDGTIEIDNARPGHPLFVKTAFNPGWRTDDGSAIDLVAPGMMLVTPRSTRVVLRWSAGTVGLAGTLVGAGALLLLAFVRTIPRGMTSDATPAAGVSWCAAIVLGTGVLAGSVILAHPAIDYGELIASGQRASAAKDFALADRIYERVLNAPDRHHAFRDEAALYFALVADAAGRPDETETRLRRFLDEFPVSTFRTEVLVRIGRLLSATGRGDEARHVFREAMDAPLGDTGWVDQARAAIDGLPRK